MQMEGCFKKDGKANTCLCFKEKDRFVFCVTRQCWLSESTIYASILTPNTELSTEKLAAKKQIAQELKSKLQSQQKMFTKSTAKSNAAVKASFIVAEEIAHASKSFRRSIFEAVHA